jgi:integrase
MPRPTKDGRPARAARKKKLSEFYVSHAKPERIAYNTWDAKQSGLVLRVQPSGHRSWRVFYRHHGEVRWYHVGNAASITIKDARRIAARVALAVAEGKDPEAERRAERSSGTFAEVAKIYVDSYSKRKNKSWRQADFLIQRYVIPRWGKLKVAAISRADVRALMAKIDRPVLANQVVATASAIFTWAVKQDIVENNPCKGVDKNEVRSRERILSDSEIPIFWEAFGDAGLVRSSALKFILLTGQRPGEVAHMRREHVKDGWWEMPGAPVAALGWPGTKNEQSHRVWLSREARAVMTELDDDAPATGFVFAGPRRAAIVGLDGAMRNICSKLKIDRATPHDLRRTFSSKVTALGFGRDAMNRVTNHKEGGIASVYDRHHYADENRRIMEAVADHVVGVAENREGDTVVAFAKKSGPSRT